MRYSKQLQACFKYYNFIECYRKDNCNNDITRSIDQGQPVFLALLDLSAAFDIANHNVPFSRLKDIFGLSGKVLECFRSYLEQRSQRVSVRGILSEVQCLLSVT